jgi:hypothetical protein
MFICIYSFDYLINNITSAFIISTLAIAISIIALIINVKFSTKNIRLSIQQTIFNTTSSKSKDCNNIWMLEKKELSDAPYYETVTEIIISIEIINKSFDLFGKNYKSISKFKDDYFYIFWKQLKTDFRIWVMNNSKNTANKLSNEVYSNQINSIHSTFKKFFEEPYKS